MFPFPNIETRKQHTKIAVKKSSEFLNIITNSPNKSAYILLYIHVILVGLPLIYIFIGNVNIYYYLSVLFWLLIMSLHFYFHGCIFTKIERYLWNSKEWYGPWTYIWQGFNFLGVEITGKFADNIFICWGTFLILFITLKFIYSIN